MLRSVQIALLVLTCVALPVSAKSLRPALLAPATLAPGVPPAISVVGLQPNEVVTLEAWRFGPAPTNEKGAITRPAPLFRASATFRADGRGKVTVRTAAPLRGTYTSADPRGLLWSGRPARASEANEGILGLKAGELRLSLIRNGRVVAHQLITFVPPTDLYVERIDTPELVGVFAAPRSAQHRPVIIALHGSEGGSWAGAEARAKLFASRGYATLALIYFAWPPSGIPNAPSAFTNLPIERLAVARDWLARRPEADTDRLGVWGASKGSEFALLGAASYPWIRSVTACVPSSLVWGGFGTDRRGLPGFTRNGRSPAFIPYGDYGPVMRGEITSTERHLRDRAAADRATVAAAMIPVERSSARLLLLSGGLDEVWPSKAMSAEIVARRRAAHRSAEWLNFPGAGHLICGTGDEPARNAVGASKAFGGGTADADGAASSRAWDATLNFFNQTLRLQTH